MIIIARLRRVAACIAGAAAICLGVFMAAVPAQAHSGASGPSAASQAVRFAAAATPRQNRIIDKYMAQYPGGTRISAGEVRWHNGTRLVTSTAAASKCPTTGYCGCDAGFFCAFPGQFTGDWWEIPNYILAHGVYFFHWGDCGPPAAPGCNVGIHAWANNTGFRTWLEQYVNNGNELCIGNRTNNLNYNGSNDLDAWIYLSSNPAKC